MPLRVVTWVLLAFAPFPPLLAAALIAFSSS